MYGCFFLFFFLLWVSLGLVGGVLVRLICLRQVDIKALIVYSSVAHMGLVLGGLATLNSLGVEWSSNCNGWTQSVFIGSILFRKYVLYMSIWESVDC